MINFKFDLPDADKIVKEAEKVSKKILMKSMFKMEELAINNAAVDQGELRLKITLFPQVLSDVYYLNSASSHSAVVEYGSRPFYAPIEPLKKWAGRKLGDENIGYAVRAKIASEGIKAQPFMRPALYQVKGYWINQFIDDELSNV